MRIFSIAALAVVWGSSSGSAIAAQACVYSGLSYSEGTRFTLASTCSGPLGGGGGRSCQVITCKNGTWYKSEVCMKPALGQSLAPCPPDVP